MGSNLMRQDPSKKYRWNVYVHMYNSPRLLVKGSYKFPQPFQIMFEVRAVTVTEEGRPSFTPPRVRG